MEKVKGQDPGDRIQKKINSFTFFPSAPSLECSLSVSQVGTVVACVLWTRAAKITKNIENNVKNPLYT